MWGVANQFLSSQNHDASSVQDPLVSDPTSDPANSDKNLVALAKKFEGKYVRKNYCKVAYITSYQ